MPVYHQMLWDADLYVGRLVDAVKARGMWTNSLVLYSADNGGTGDGINWPLRGTKHTKYGRQLATILLLRLHRLTSATVAVDDANLLLL